MEEEEAYDNALSASEAWNLLVDYIGECLDMDTLQAIFESCESCLEISMEAALNEVQLRYCLEDPLVEPEPEFQMTLKEDEKDIAADILEEDEAFPPLHKCNNSLTTSSSVSQLFSSSSSSSLTLISQGQDMTMECTTTVQEQKMGGYIFSNHIEMDSHEPPEVPNTSDNNEPIGRYQHLVLSLMEAFPNTRQDVIECIVRECDGNEGRCTQYLLDEQRRCLILTLMEAFPEKDEETIGRVVSECDGDEECSMQFLLDRTYLSACTRTQLLPQSQPIKTNRNPIQSPIVDIMDNNCGGPPLPLPSRISPPLPSRLRKSNITSHAAAKLRVEASHEAEKMKLLQRKMVREMKTYPGAGEISRQEGKACRLRMISLHSRAAAIMLQATNRGLSFNCSSITEGDNEELKLSHLQLAAWNLTDGGALVCDLHGLTIEEAKASIDIVLNGSGFYLKCKQMASSWSRPNPTSWIFVTGVGNHSKGGKPILTPAVKRHLTRSLGLNIVENLPGALQVIK